MAVQQPVLNGVTLPHVSRYKPTRVHRGGREVMADGSTAIATVTVGAKAEWDIEWLGLTHADYLDIVTAFDVAARQPVSFVPVSGGSVLTVVAAQTLDVTAFATPGGNLRYNVHLVLRQQ